MSLLSKLDLYNFLMDSLKEQEARYQGMLKSINDSKNNETKSSAGDKFETGRAMMQAEQDKVDMQLSNVYKNIEVIKMIRPETIESNITLGSLVTCGSMQYYISVGFGKINLLGRKVYAISPSSPLGLLLIGKTEGETYHFNNQLVQITSVE